MSKLCIMKEVNLKTSMLSADEFERKFSPTKGNKSIIKKYSLLLCVLGLICLGFIAFNFKVTDMETGETIALITTPIASTTEKKDVISIPTGIVKANPFVPYRKLGNEIQLTPELINDVPKYDLIAPPEALQADSEAAKILTTTVSGILYDKYSPSAILNIDGNDYLVKKGDTVSRYKVIAIAKDSVTVKTGNNTYTAGIGEMLTDGNLNYNDISDLNKKFGGERR